MHNVKTLTRNCVTQKQRFRWTNYSFITQKDWIIKIAAIWGLFLWSRVLWNHCMSYEIMKNPLSISTLCHSNSDSQRKLDHFTMLDWCTWYRHFSVLSVAKIILDGPRRHVKLSSDYRIENISSFFKIVELCTLQVTQMKNHSACVNWQA